MTTVPGQIPCVLCEIVAGRAESSVAYEDGHVIAFMDIQPVTQGHALVVPRAHVDVLEALDEDLGAHLFRAGRRLARGLRRSGPPCAGVNMFLADGEAAFQEVVPCASSYVPPDARRWLPHRSGMAPARPRGTRRHR